MPALLSWQADLPDLGDLGLPDLQDQERRAAQQTWLARMVNETVSSRVFAALLGQLLAAGGKPADLQALATFAADELRHGQLCAAVAHQLGATAEQPLPPLPAVPDHADTTPQLAVLRNILSVCCLSETVAVALIRAEHAELQGTPLGTVLGQILADEVQHARFGWHYLANVAPGLTAQDRQELGEWLAVALAHLWEHELAHLPYASGRSVAAQAVGICDGVAARKLLRDAIEQVIVPGLERQGLAGERAWGRVVARSQHGPA
jgi:hypothetical protein